jgi:LmbE family N-acetylglucosaminyl deacetylase
MTYLVVAAHPDDPDFGVAGTAASLARAGHAVHYLMCTSGDAGGEDPSVPDEDLMRVREAEQQAAGRILGLSGVHFLRFPDGELEPSIALRKAIVRIMRQVQADVVICQDPRALVDDEGTYLNHPDHRAAGQAALDAAFPAAGNPRAFRDLLAEGLQPHKIREVWLYFTASAQANHWVDISATIEQKIAALEAHDSQIGDWARSGGLRRETIKWASEEATKRELGYEYAEGFQRIVLQSDDAEKPAEAEAVEAQADQDRPSTGSGRAVA